MHSPASLNFHFLLIQASNKLAAKRQACSFLVGGFAETFYDNVKTICGCQAAASAMAAKAAFDMEEKFSAGFIPSQALFNPRMTRGMFRFDDEMDEIDDDD